MNRPSLAHAMPSQIPRRSSSADLFNLHSQQNSQGRESNMGGRQSSIGRSSSIGRASSIMSIKTNESKTSNQIDMAQSISMVLDILSFQPQVNTKILLTPSTTTFYTIFEYLLLAINIKDVWSQTIFLTSQQNQPKNQIGSQSSQQQKLSQIEINKNKIEILIGYLNFFGFPNVPKPSVFQNMTTPKNWYTMLQILDFFSCNVRFLQVVNAGKILYPPGSFKEIIFEFLKKMFPRYNADHEFLETEEYKKIKMETLKFYKTQLYANLAMEQVQAEHASHREEFEMLNNNRNELEDMLKKEQELQQMFNKLDAEYVQKYEKYEEKKKLVEMSRRENESLVKLVKQSFDELAVKEKNYERQLSLSGENQNLSTKHAECLKEVESCENAIYDLDAKKDNLEIKLLQKNNELKQNIDEFNQITNRLKSSSTVKLTQLPELDLLDFHKKPILVADYKESFLKIRQELNSYICEFPDELMKLKEEKKKIDNEITAIEVKLEKNKLEAKKFEKLYQEAKKSTEEAVINSKFKVNNSKNEHLRTERENKLSKEELEATRIEQKDTIQEYKRIENDLEEQCRASSQGLEQVTIECEQRKQKTEKTLADFYKNQKEKIVRLTNILKERTELAIQEKIYLDKRKQEIDLLLNRQSPH